MFLYNLLFYLKAHTKLINKNKYIYYLVSIKLKQRFFFNSKSYLYVPVFYS